MGEDAPSHPKEPLHNSLLQQPEQQKRVSLPNHILLRLLGRSALVPHRTAAHTGCWVPGASSGHLGVKHLPQIILQPGPPPSRPVSGGSVLLRPGPLPALLDPLPDARATPFSFSLTAVDVSESSLPRDPGGWTSCFHAPPHPHSALPPSPGRHPPSASQATPPLPSPARCPRPPGPPLLPGPESW